jgi:hypothetical protein
VRGSARGALYRKALELGVTKPKMRLDGLDSWSSAPRAPAEQPQRLSISMPSPLQAEPASRARLPIQIEPPEALQKNSFLRIRGLPPTAALS